MRKLKKEKWFYLDNISQYNNMSCKAKNHHIDGSFFMHQFKEEAL